MIRLIVAVDQQRGIAKNGKQPWKLPADEHYFAAQTKQYGAVVLMGFKTYQVIGRPLPGRDNYVLTTQQRAPVVGITWVHNLTLFLQQHLDVWVIGGAAVYEATVDVADEIYITQIEVDYGCDQFFPVLNEKFSLVESHPEVEGSVAYAYQRFVRSVKNVATVTE